MKKNLTKLLKRKSLISCFFMFNTLLSIAVVILINLIISKQKNKTHFIARLTLKPSYLEHNYEDNNHHKENTFYKISFVESVFPSELKKIQNYYHIYGISYLK